MKVLQINSFFSVGGPPRIMNGIYDTLKEYGYDCKIAAAREKMYAVENSYRVGSNLSIKCNALKARLFDNEGFNAKSATRDLIDYIREYDPDIIHLHNLHGYCFNLDILFNYLKRINKPVVWTLHDCWSMTGHCAHFSIVGCEKWRTGCYSCPQIREYPSSFGVDNSMRNYIAKQRLLSDMNKMVIVTPSRWLASFVPNSLLKNNPVTVIYNGIDLNLFTNTPSDILEKNGLSNKKIVLGVAQNWAENKGLEDFVVLSNQLSEDYQIVLIGLTEEQIKRLPPSIFALNRTENVNELIKWYSAATVFVNFTYQDTFPTVNLEALACGTPVITYRTGGSPEAIDDTCGWVIEQGKTDAARLIIEHIDGDSHFLKACMSRAQLFDRKERYKEYIDLYKKLLID